MKARAKKRLGFLPFEARKPECQFASIAKDMAESPAWQGLNLRQRGLYLELKLRYWRKVQGGVVTASNKDDVVFTKADAMRLYGNFKTFKDDMSRLMEYGFIYEASNGKYCFQANKYGFSDKWQTFRPPAKPKRQRNKDETQTQTKLHNSGVKNEPL